MTEVIDLPNKARCASVRLCWLLMNIRPATVLDAPFIAKVHVSSWREAYRGLLPQAALDQLDVGQRAAQWQQWLADPAVTTVLVEDQSRVVGFANFGAARSEAAPNIGEIMAIYVEPSSWGKGFGWALCQRAIEGLAENGFREAYCWVLEGNTRDKGG